MQQFFDVSLAFRAIKDMVSDLNELYSGNNKSSPLALYTRLIGHVKEEEILSLNSGTSKFINGFELFFGRYAKFLNNTEDLMNNLSRNAVIPFGNNDKIYIDIQKFLYKSDNETRDAIRLHLMTIYTIMYPNEDTLKNLSKRSSGGKKLSAPSCDNEQFKFLKMMGIDTTTSEGKFALDMIGDIQNCLDGQNLDDPAAAMMNLLPVLPNVMQKLRNGIDDGSFDISKLISMQSKFENMPQPEGCPNLVDIMSQMQSNMQDFTPESKKESTRTCYDEVD